MRRIADNHAEAVPSDCSAKTMADTLADDIIFGRLAPGAALREERLLERFGASRHVVREALLQLEGRKLIVRERNRGAAVRVMTADEVRDLHEVREMLQRHAALRIRLPIGDADFAVLAGIDAEFQACVAAHDLRGMHDANDRFHDALFGLCGNRHLQRLIRELLEVSYLVRTRGLDDAEDRAKAMSEHRAMLGLLRSTDNWALAELCVAHIRPRRDSYLEFLGTLDQTRRRRRSRAPSPIQAAKAR